MKKIFLFPQIQIAIALLLLFPPDRTFAANLLSDDFNGSSLDLDKWTPRLEIPGSSVTQGSGYIELVNGGTLVTKNAFAETVTIKARFQLRAVERSNLKFVLRTDGEKIGSERKGIAIQLQCRTDWNGYIGQLAIFEIGTPTPAFINFTTPLNLDQWYTVVIVDKGQSIDLYFDGATTPSLTLASSFSAGQNVAIYNREGGAAGSSISEGGTARLDNVEIVPTDSDNDGVNDYREDKDGTDPNDANSFNPLSKGLVAHYPFEGNADDESGYANNGSVTGAMLSVDRLGQSDSAYYFDGSSFITGGNVVPNYKDGVTLSCWVKTSHLGSLQGAVCKPRPYGDYGGFALGVSNPAKAYTGFNTDPYYDSLQGGVIANTAVQSSSSIADDRWHHLVATVDGKTLKLYLDGLFVGEEAFVSDAITSNRLLQIGREGEGGAQYGPRWFFGSLDEVRVYSRALPEDQVRELYEAETASMDSDSDGVTDYRERRDGTNPYDLASFEPLSVALIANYPFDNSWKDESGYGRDASGSYTTFEPGLLGSALSFAEGNSQGGYWTDPGNINTLGRINTFTFSVWMKAATLEQADISSYYLVSAPNNAAYLRIRNGTGGLHVLGMGHEWSGIPGYGYQTPETDLLRPMVWQHVVGVQEGEATRIYVNGQLVGSTDSGGEIPFDPANFTFGNLFNQNTFQGLLDEIRIYGRTLSSVEVAALYVLEVGDLDSDKDGLPDVNETNTGAFVSAIDTGTDPYNPDTSGDGILDGEAVLWNFNPLTDHSQVLAFLRHATGVESGRFALYTEGSIMDLNLGGVMMQKSGSQASVRFKVESKMDLRDASWSDRGTYLLPPVDMPGSKGFLRIRAEQP